MRIQCAKCQQYANNLRRNKDVNIAEMMCKFVNQQSAPNIDIGVFDGNPFEFHYCLLWSRQKENWRTMWKAHTIDQIYHWRSKGDGQELHTASSRFRIRNCKADDGPVVWRSTPSNCSITQRDQAVATDQTRRCWSI